MICYYYRITTVEGLRRRGIVRACDECTAIQKLIAAFGPLQSYMIIESRFVVTK